MKRLLAPALLAAVCGLVLAKIPPPDPATKAKADEAAAKTAWQGKVDAYLTCKVQDKIAAQYLKSAGKPAPAVAAPAASKAASAAAPAVARAASGSAGAASASMAAASTSAPSGTPVAFAPPPPCADPGPFAYNKPEEKPLETSGAHSPAGNATSPPSVRQESATMAPAKK
ncbi:hypothetical protein [Caenimonas aquaedulcis]|uniref:Uncharacterized protein n=1 Tax=Caenimonas aquaedulcis TaxID=2793270 RepID=A0A931H3U0_9BURK|nr:hypothetical protein [Caenimonas aquaedulcis]MBG9388090.1 hypothetical protein [Caenimonas aquaedulcis]